MTSIRISLEFGYTEFFAHNSYGTIAADDIDWEDLKEEQQEYIIRQANLAPEAEQSLKEDIQNEGSWWLAEMELVEVRGECSGKRCWAEGYWEKVVSLEEWNSNLQENPNLLQQLKEELGLKIVKFGGEEEL